MAAAATSGKTLLAYTNFLARNYGPDAFDRVLAKMQQSERTPLQGIVLPSAWYPTDAVVAAIEAGRLVFGGADFFERFGESSAMFAINAFYRFLLRFRSPHWILERQKAMWRQYHSTGEWKMDMTERSFHGELHDFATYGSYCRVLVGWIQTAGRMTGARGAEVTHPRCRGAGAPACVFVGRW